MMTQKIMYEYRAHPRRHGPTTLLSREGCAGRKGFISVCGYTEDVAEYIKETNSTYGLHRFPLYVDRAILDFDDSDEEYRAAILKCRSEGWGYRAYHTGNRGYHIYIDIEPYLAVRAYEQLGRWVEENFVGYDPCLYKSSSITRIPGTIHHKTGKPMTLVDKVEGTKADITTAKIVIEKPKVFIYEDEKDVVYYNELFQSMLNQKTYSGGRHAALFKLAAVGIKADLDDEFLLGSITRWNNRKCRPPLTNFDIEKAINCATRKVKECV